MVDLVKRTFKPTCRTRGLSADTASQALKRIEDRDSELTAEAVVKDAMPKRSTLHKFFEWDDSKAGHQYRLEQARYLIRHFIIEVEDTKVATRSWVMVRKGDKSEQVYRDTIIVMDTPEFREQLVGRALDDLNSWRRKHAAVVAVAEISRRVKSLADALVKRKDE